MPYFICTGCGHRIFDSDGRQGLSYQAVGCPQCGSGYLFELLEDYFAPAGAGMFACDRELRVLATGMSAFELTGLSEAGVMGKPLAEALGLRFAEGDPLATAAEWGVRQLGKPATIRHAAGFDKGVVCDIFPAYDDDGGLLVVVAPPVSDADD